MRRLQTRAQFQAAMAGGVIARTAHFALHRLVLHRPAPPTACPAAPHQPVPPEEPASALEAPELHSKAALLMDANTGAVVYAKNEHDELYPASLTKIKVVI